MSLTRYGNNLMIKIMLERLKVLDRSKHLKPDKKLTKAYRD